jgi:hypothetical protein
MKHFTPRHRRRDRRTDRKRTRRRRRERRASRDASGGRDEHRNRDVPLPDGGTTDTPDDVADDLPKFVPEPGALVKDREADPGEGELLVLEVLGTRADEHLVEGTEQTVAEYNTGYPPESPVVRAIYPSDLDSDHRPRREWHSLQTLRGRVDEGELRAYDFPAARLGPLPARSRRDGEGEQ